MRMPLRPLFVLLAVVAASSWPVAPAFAATDAPGTSWSVSPVAAADGSERGNFDLVLDPGAVVSDAFRVRNDGATPLDLSVYAADAYTTREGSLDLPPAGTASVDGGRWVAPATDAVHLEPGQETVVPFTVAVPADARPGDHPAGIVAALRTTGDGQVALDRRLGSRIHLRVTGDLTPSVAVSAPTATFSGTWNPFGIGDVELVYDVTNTGNTRITGVATPAASGPLGLLARSGDPERLPEIMPGSTVQVRQHVPAVAALGYLDTTVAIAGESVGIGAGPIAPVSTGIGLVAVPVVPAASLIGAAGISLAIGIALRRRRRPVLPPATPTPVG